MEVSLPLCRRCGRAFTTLLGLRKHLQFMHGLEIEELACSLCQVHLSSFREYRLHTLSTHQQARQIQALCGVCNYSTVSANRLWDHIRCVHLHQPFTSRECSICAHTVSGKHLRTHYSVEHPLVSCYRCKEVFGSFHAYTIHFNLAHNNKTRTGSRPKLITCGICGEKFQDAKHFTHHMLSIHLGQVPIHCTMCPYCYRMLPLTERRTHNDSEHALIQCLHCHQSFSRACYPHHLDTHLF